MASKKNEVKNVVKNEVKNEKKVKTVVALPKVEVSREVKVIIGRIKKKIEAVGKTSKDICKDMALIEDKDNKFVIKELGISKVTISQMKSAGRIYNNFACLDSMTHTNIVELAPLFKDGYDKKVLDEFVVYVFPDKEKATDEEKGLALATLPQRKLREAVKEFICPVVKGELVGEEVEGEGEGEKAKKKANETDSFKELEKLLKKYKVTKEDMEKVKEIVENIVNEAM